MRKEGREKNKKNKSNEGGDEYEIQKERKTGKGRGEIKGRGKGRTDRNSYVAHICESDSEPIQGVDSYANDTSLLQQSWI